jgi:hypothetical protein
MTTVAFDGKTLAADRRMGGWLNVCKIFRLKDGRVAAGCGRNFDAIREIITWLDAKSPTSKRPEIEEADAPDLLLVSPKGVLQWMTWPYSHGMEVREPFFAIGSGARYALGALAAGCSARRAVAIACRFDVHSGQGIDAVRVVKGATK